MPLTPIQKSAGVNAILESTGFMRRSGVYSAGQPKISPRQRLPTAWRWAAKALTSLISGIASDNTGEYNPNFASLLSFPACTWWFIEICFVVPEFVSFEPQDDWHLDSSPPTATLPYEHREIKHIAQPVVDCVLMDRSHILRPFEANFGMLTGWMAHWQPQRCFPLKVDLSGTGKIAR